MKIEIKNEKILQGIELVNKYVHEPIESKFSAISAEKGNANRLLVQGREVKIEYVDESGFYTALGVALASEGDVNTEIKKKMKDMGVMLDCARNAVIRPSEAKRMLVSCALLGYTYFELYVEDCFEVDDEP